MDDDFTVTGTFTVTVTQEQVDAALAILGCGETDLRDAVNALGLDYCVEPTAPERSARPASS